MTHKTATGPIQTLLLVLCGLLGLLAVARLLASPRTDAGLARQAMQMTQDAYRQARLAARDARATRLIALAVGTAAPLVVVYFIYRLQSRRDVPAEDILQMLNEERLLAPPQGRIAELSSEEPPLLEGKPQSDKGSPAPPDP